MRAALIITAGLLASSSFAFAGKNGGSDNGGRNGMPDNPAAASITDRFDPPDETTVRSCESARVHDANCKNALSR